MTTAGRCTTVFAGAGAGTLIVVLLAARAPTKAIREWWDLRQLRLSVISDGTGWIEFAPDPVRADEGTKPLPRRRPESFRELLQLWSDCSGDQVVYCGGEEILERSPVGVFLAWPPGDVNAELMATLFEALRFSVEKEIVAGTDTVWLVGRTTLETCGAR